MIEAEAVRVRCARGGDRIRTWEQKAVANATAFLFAAYSDEFVFHRDISIQAERITVWAP